MNESTKDIIALLILMGLEVLLTIVRAVTDD